MTWRREDNDQLVDAEHAQKEGSMHRAAQRWSLAAPQPIDRTNILAERGF